MTEMQACLGDLVLDGEADIPAATRVLYGPERAFKALRGELDMLGTKRAFLVTGRSLAQSDLVGRLKSALGDRLAGHFGQMGEHSPRSKVLAAADATRAAGADALIAIGGGSSIIGTKGVALTLAEGRDFDALKAHYDYKTRAITVPRLIQPKLPIIAIPTTLSAVDCLVRNAHATPLSFVELLRACATRTHVARAYSSSMRTSHGAAGAAAPAGRFV